MQFEDPLYLESPDQSSSNEVAQPVGQTEPSSSAADSQSALTPEQIKADYEKQILQLKSENEKRLRDKDSDIDRRVFHETKRQVTPILAAIQELKNELTGSRVRQTPEEELDPQAIAAEKRFQEAARREARRVLTEEMGLDPSRIQATNSSVDRQRFFSENPAAADVDNGYGMFFLPALAEMEKHFQVDQRMLNALDLVVKASISNMYAEAQKRGLSVGSPQSGSGAGNGTKQPASPTQKNDNTSHDDQEALLKREEESSTSRPGMSLRTTARPKARNAQDIANFLQGKFVVPNEK